MFKNIKLFCSHQYGLVNESRYQYCSKCGKARFVDNRTCKHNWISLNEMPYKNSGVITGYIYVRECIHCGEIKTHIIDKNILKN